jgi:hypothetical protein
MSSLKAAKDNSLWQQFLSIIGLRKEDADDDNTPRTKPSPASALPVLRDEALDFGSFVAVHLPADTPPRLAKAGAKDLFAGQIAQRVRESLSRIGIQSYNLVELYTPSSTQDTIMGLYDTEALVKKFQQICETEIFGISGSFDDAQGADDAQRVQLVRRRIMFHPAFDHILQGRLIVRPLGTGKVPVPRNPSEVNLESDQILIGLLQVFGIDRTRLAEAPIWAWRSIKDQNTIIIDVDFDLFTRAFDPEVHYFPMGLSIRCTFRQIGQIREIEQVSMEIQEAKRWIDYLGKTGSGDKVTYHVDIGTGFEPEKYLLKDHPQDSIDVVKESTGKAFSLGGDETGKHHQISINRQLSIIVKSGDKSYAYRFGFFERALNYVPVRNIMRITGQLIPEAEAVDVMLPPGAPDYKQTPIFRLSPTSSMPRHFVLTVRDDVAFDLTLNEDQELSPGDEVSIQEGDTIEATSDVRVGGTGRKKERYVFTLKDLSRIPESIRSRAGRKYAAFFEVNAPREFVLFDKEHVFGRGQYFHDEAFGIKPGALKFKRPWVFLTMKPAEKQEIWYLNKSSETATVPVLPLGGVQLELNAVYEIYLGDFQITLNLKATPLTSEV